MRVRRGRGRAGCVVVRQFKFARRMRECPESVRVERKGQSKSAIGISHVYDPLRYTPRMDPGALRTGGKLGKQLTFPGGDPLVSLGSE